MDFAGAYRFASVTSEANVLMAVAYSVGFVILISVIIVAYKWTMKEKPHPYKTVILPDPAAVKMEMDHAHRQYP
jgi:hypothetical protein